LVEEVVDQTLHSPIPCSGEARRVDDVECVVGDSKDLLLSMCIRAFGIV